MADDERDLSAVLAENLALRAANCDLAVTVARLHAELAERPAAPHRAPPPRGPPSLQETPVEVLAQILGFLDSPRDVFAVARSCRLGREASRTRGAFRHVDLRYTDVYPGDSHEEFVNPETGELEAADMGDEPPRASASGQFLAFLASCDAAAGIRSVVLCRLCGSVAAAGVSALLRLCTALESLEIRGQSMDEEQAWTPEEVAIMLRAASAAPVRRLSVPFLGKLEALPEFSCLESLELRHETHELFYGGVTGTLEEVQRVQAVLPRLIALRELSINACFGSMLPFAVRSATLERFKFFGRQLCITAMDCPRLTSVDVCEMASTPALYARMALNLIRGCPLLHWRNPPIEELPQLTDEDCRRNAMQAWLACAQAQENDPLLRQLVNDEDAVSFLIGIILRPIVNGRLQ